MHWIPYMFTLKFNVFQWLIWAYINMYLLKMKQLGALLWDRPLLGPFSMLVLRVVTAWAFIGHLQWFFYIPHWNGTDINVILRFTRDTESPMLRARFVHQNIPLRALIRYWAKATGMEGKYANHYYYLCHQNTTFQNPRSSLHTKHVDVVGHWYRHFNNKIKNITECWK